MFSPRRIAAVLTLMAAAALMLVPLRASAVSRLYLHTFNASSSNKAWVTVQNSVKTVNLDSGWIAPMTKRVWWSGHYLTGSYYFVRFEFVDAHNKPVCDTKARIFAEYTTGDRTDTATGHYKDGKCWIVATDKAIPW